MIDKGQLDLTGFFRFIFLAGTIGFGTATYFVPYLVAKIFLGIFTMLFILLWWECRE